MTVAEKLDHVWMLSRKYPWSYHSIMQIWYNLGYCSMIRLENVIKMVSSLNGSFFK